jgi:hypothetical protein
MISFKNKLNLLFLVSVFLIPIICFSQKPIKLKPKKALNIAFYNLDHFYDTLENEKKDTSYLPSGSKKWNSERYNSKLSQLSTVLDSLNQNFNIEILGLTDFENDSVLNDLISKAKFTSNKKKIFQSHSAPLLNNKGLSVGIVYDAKKIKMIETAPVPLHIKAKYTDTIENIGIWMKAVFMKDTLHFIVVKFHDFTLDDMNYNLNKRINAAYALKKFINERKITDDKKLIIMGDFNETPFGTSVRMILSTTHPDSLERHRAKYPNLMYSLSRKGAFTSIHKGEKILNNQFITSTATYFDLKKGMQVYPNSAKVFAPEWLKTNLGFYTGGPAPTFHKYLWYDTPSGHFPIMMTLYYAKKRKAVNK